LEIHLLDEEGVPISPNGNGGMPSAGIQLGPNAFLQGDGRVVPWPYYLGWEGHIYRLGAAPRGATTFVLALNSESARTEFLIPADQAVVEIRLNQEQRAAFGLE
ncbi:MAG: hypothetical protein ACPG31_13930, partial [Planctomycetota bacterium]